MELDLAITDLVNNVTKKWAKQRKAEERSARAVANRRTVFTRSRWTIKAAAYRYMEEAYLKASGNGRFPANARQIMYAARPLIQAATGQDLADNYFTQTLLPNYIEERGKAWDVVFDARGHFAEPHGTISLPLGTLAVRRYLDEANRHTVKDPSLELIGSTFPTSGSANRYGAVLFIEKEGFDEILRAAKIADRYDIAVMSTKGMSVTASRLLVDRLHVPLLVLHDFDQSGFSIIGTLRRSTRRYQFARRVEVVDLGLTLADIEEHGLDAEYQPLTQGHDTLRRNGATAADIAFLEAGQRVELNALGSDQLVELIDAKLTALGIQKVVPDADLLTSAYRRAYKVALLNRTLKAAGEDADEVVATVAVPDDIADQVRDHLKDHPDEPWDVAVAGLVDGILTDLEATP